MAPRGRSPVLVDCFLGDMSAGPPKHDRRHRQRKHRGRCRLLEVMRLPPVINTLAAVAPVKDLLQLLQTCRETAQMKGSVIASEWNIDRFLAHFLPSPTTFRQLQAASGAIITGPAVRSFLDRALTSGPNGNLAVIVTLGQDGDLRAYPDGTHMQRSRVRTGMFRAVGRNVSAPTAPKLLIQYYGSSAITRSARYTSSDGAVIDLIVTETAVLRCLLINCLTSTQANFMTASRAISLFPYPTFISGASFLCGEMTPSAVTQERLQVDFESGYVVQHNPWKGEIPKSVNPFKRYRRVGDRFTWSTNLTGWEAHSKTCLDLQIDVSTFTVRFGSAVSFSHPFALTKLWWIYNIITLSSNYCI